MNKGMTKTVITKEKKVKNRVLDISPKCSKSRGVLRSTWARCVAMRGYGEYPQDP